MYCPNCGKQLPDGASFCGACGTALKKPEANSQVATPAQRSSAQRPSAQAPSTSWQPASASQRPATKGIGAFAAGVSDSSDRKPLIIAAVAIAVVIGLVIWLITGLVSCAGGPVSLPSEMVGTWSDGMTYSTFPISQLELSQDGSVVLYMDEVYTGHVEGGGGEYRIVVDDATSTIGSVTVDEVKRGLDITCRYLGDNTLEVHVVAKSGYYYYGTESQMFEKV